MASSPDSYTAKVRQSVDGWFANVYRNDHYERSFLGQTRDEALGKARAWVSADQDLRAEGEPQEETVAL